MQTITLKRSGGVTYLILNDYEKLYHWNSPTWVEVGKGRVSEKENEFLNSQFDILCKQ